MLGSWLSTADLALPPVASRIKYQLCWLKAPIKCSYKIFPNRWRNNGHILRNGWLITYNWWVLPITWGGNCLISSREGSKEADTLDIWIHSPTTLPPLYPNQSCGHMDCFIENLIVSIICTLYLRKQKQSSFRGSNKIISMAVNHAAPTHGGVSPLSRQSRAWGRGGVGCLFRSSGGWFVM